MGYDLHITRRKDWSTTGNDISADEWLAYVEKDPELSLWPTNGPHMVRWSGGGKHPELCLDWFQGNIYAKNPEPALIDKMIQIADALGAKVQGDDAEIYRNGQDTPIYPQPSTFDRLLNWLRARRPTRRVKPIRPPFEVGDRVLDAYGKVATVIQIDPKSNNNLGKVMVRYEDGRELSFMLIASGLSRIQGPQKHN
jgi:hypothetical protein